MGNLRDTLEVDAEASSLACSDSLDKEAPKVLLALSAALERLVLRNDRCTVGNLSEYRKLTVFHGLRPPNISIQKYLERIHRHAKCSLSCLVIGFIYIDNLVHKRPDLPLISLNVHRLLITSIMVATKLFDDEHYNNAFYARVGGISNAEINSLEMDFLLRLDFRLQVTLNTFEGYCTHLERELLLARSQIEKTLPSTADPLFHGNGENQKMVEDEERKLRHLMNHNPSVVSAKTLEPSKSPSE